MSVRHERITDLLVNRINTANMNYIALSVNNMFSPLDILATLINKWKGGVKKDTVRGSCKTGDTAPRAG